MRGHDRGGTIIFAVRPVRRAGGCATGAQNALRRFVEAGAVFGALQSLASIRRKRGVVDEVRKHLLVVVKERLHIHDQILDDLQAQHRLHRDIRAHIAHQSFAGQHDCAH